MTAPSSPPASRRRWLAPRYSLRTLLVAMTAACIAAAIWWRWPFEVERKGVLLRVMESTVIDLGKTATGGTRRLALEFSPYIAQREISTVHRGWGGELIRHGATRYYNGDDRLIGEDHYCEGVLHGPSKRWIERGDVVRELNFKNGLLDGPFREIQCTAGYQTSAELGYPSGIYGVREQTKREPVSETPLWEAIGTYTAGRQKNKNTIEHLQGEARLIWRWNNEKCQKLEWERGGVRLDISNGIEPMSRLECRLILGLELRAVWEIRDFDVRNVPLSRFVEQAEMEFDERVQLDEQALGAENISPNTPITGSVKSQPGFIGLLHVLLPYGLTCDLRDGELWITTPKAASKREGPSTLRPHTLRVFSESRTAN